MQQFLLLALHGLLVTWPWMAMIKISRISRWIYNKVWNPREIESLKDDVVVNLTLVEMHFPPSFFHIMIHLLYHLVDELNLCGLVAIRWMYPVER
jgi:hypothetical protein